MNDFKDEIKLKKFTDFVLLFVACLFYPALMSAILMTLGRAAFATMLWLLTAFITYNHCVITCNSQINFGNFFLFYYLSTAFGIFLAIISSKESYT